MWNILTTPKFDKSFKKLSKVILEKVYLFTKELKNGYFPEGYDIKKLKNRDNEYRCRIGKYRIVYQVYKSEILILLVDVDLRKDIYK